MALVNAATREIHCKIVYYGPGLGGKTTNLDTSTSKAPPDASGKLLSLATEAERTLFFDFLPLDLGDDQRLQDALPALHRARPGLSTSAPAARPEGVDGVVFVADSQVERLGSEPRVRWRTCTTTSRRTGSTSTECRSSSSTTSATCPDAVPVPVLEARLNKWGAPHVEAVASSGQGVLPTLREISKLVVARL